MKKGVSSAQDLGANVDAKKEKCGVRYGGANNGVRSKISILLSTLSDNPHILQMSIMQLPKDELMTLNPLDFWVFMCSLDKGIRSIAMDVSAKFNRLFQYCKGEPSKSSSAVLL